MTFPTPAYGPGYSMMPGTYTPAAGSETTRTETGHEPMAPGMLEPFRRLNKRLPLLRPQRQHTASSACRRVTPPGACVRQPVVGDRCGKHRGHRRGFGSATTATGMSGGSTGSACRQSLRGVTIPLKKERNLGHGEDCSCRRGRDVGSR